MRLVCGLLGHRRVRRQVWNDGENWRCACPRCGTELVKDWRTGRWHPPAEQAS